MLRRQLLLQQLFAICIVTGCGSASLVNGRGSVGEQRQLGGLSGRSRVATFGTTRDHTHPVASPTPPAIVVLSRRRRCLALSQDRRSSHIELV